MYAWPGRILVSGDNSVKRDFILKKRIQILYQSGTKTHLLHVNSPFDIFWIADSYPDFFNLNLNVRPIFTAFDSVYLHFADAELLGQNLDARILIGFVQNLF